MPRKRPLSVKEKTVRLIFSASSTLLLLAALLFALVQGRFIYQSTLQGQHSLGDLVVSNARLPLALSDVRQAQRILDSVATHPEVATAYLLRTSGVPLAAYFRTDATRWRIDTAEDLRLLEQEEGQIAAGLEQGTSMEWHQRRSLALFKPIHYEGMRVGYLYLRADTADLHRQMLTLVLGWLLLCGVAVILSYLFSLRLLGYISRPIDGLVTQMRRVSEERSLGGLQTTGVQDEFALLYQGFDEMLAALRERDRRLEEHRQSLESQVKVRTAELEQARAEAEQASQAKSSFLAKMSHEIRTPMIGVLGMSELLCQTDLPERERGLAATIHSSGEALLEILNDLLDFSKAEAGQMPLRKVPFDLRECLHGVVALLRVNAEAKGLKLILDCSESLPTCVVGDAGRLRQLLLNLVGNAIKFTEQGEVVLRAAASPSVEKGGARLLFEVIDTGIGIPASEQEQVFESFSQGSRDHRQPVAGTGLGLAIVRQLVTLMGGTIELDSEVGRGSCFRVRLPMVVGDLPTTEPASPLSPAAGCIEERTAQSSAERGRHAGRRVLVAEDTPATRQLLEILLHNLGLRVTIVDNGRQALAAFSRETPDLVLMDCQMPVMDGYQATHQLRENGYAGPIVALTAFARSEDEALCRAAGMDDFLCKPFRQHQLRTMLDKWLPAPADAFAAGPETSSPEGRG
ncbi:MAG: ATP-binding protein [Desulfuromonadales bacterium]|nr:ATP-binding protein [Desulfuromonadales bacterium]